MQNREEYLVMAALIDLVHVVFTIFVLVGFVVLFMAKRSRTFVNFYLSVMLLLALAQLLSGGQCPLTLWSEQCRALANGLPMPTFVEPAVSKSIRSLLGLDVPKPVLQFVNIVFVCIALIGAVWAKMNVKDISEVDEHVSQSHGLQQRPVAGRVVGWRPEVRGPSQPGRSLDRPASQQQPAARTRQPGSASGGAAERQRRR